MIKTFLNPKGYQNRISGSKVTAILLKGRVLPIGGASAVEGLRSMGLPCLVLEIQCRYVLHMLASTDPMSAWTPHMPMMY